METSIESANLLTVTESLKYKIGKISLVGNCYWWAFELVFLMSVGGDSCGTDIENLKIIVMDEKVPKFCVERRAIPVPRIHSRIFYFPNAILAMYYDNVQVSPVRVPLYEGITLYDLDFVVIRNIDMVKLMQQLEEFDGICCDS